MKGLVDQGYTIGPAMLWQDTKGAPPKLALLMVPHPEQSSDTTAATRRYRWATVSLLMVCAVLLATLTVMSILGV